jgi:RNA polymerase sigma-70 factor (ECF subfamily)
MSHHMLGVSVSSDSRDLLGTDTSGVVDFDSFYRREYRAVRAVAWTLTGSGPAAEDVAQEAFLRAHQRWSQVSTYDEPGAWVRRVAINLATSTLRRRAREAAALVRLAGRRPDDWQLPDADHEFWAAVRSLPRQQARVVALHYYEDLPVADIAVVLELAKGTVKAHLHKGRASLARRLRLAEEDR